MKPNLRQHGTPPLGPRQPSRARRGVALIITLTIMALLLILAVAFVVNMRTERLATRGFADQLRSRESALSGLHAAIAQMQTFFCGIERSNCVVATMPGMFYWTNVATHTTSYLPMFSYQPPDQVQWFTFSGRPVNLNSGNYQYGLRYLPIFNPYNMLSASANDMNAVPIYVDWLPIWQTTDSRINTVTTSAGSTTLSQNSGYVGRFGFWVDDESVKINLCNAGVASLTNIVYIANPPGKMATPMAVIQPTTGRFDTKHTSSIDLAALDINSITPNKWSSGVLPDLEQARNPAPSRWVKLQTPEDIVGIAGNISMADFQAAKPCLTVWSEDPNDFCQIFRYGYVNKSTAVNNNRPQVRTNVSVTIDTTAKRDILYFFLVNQLLKSTPFKNYCGGATYDEKYKSDPPYRQPLLGGSLEQIVANIVAYVSQPDVPAIVTKGDGSGTTASIVTSFPTGFIPVGACGLRKAAYMNEVVTGLYWQETKDKDPKQPSKWNLYAAIYVEMVNPYPDDLPRSTPPPGITSSSFPEAYSINFDGPIQFKGTLAPIGGSAPANLDFKTPTPQPLILQATEAIPAHGYSKLTTPTLVVGNAAILLTSSAIESTAGKPPVITDLKITFPNIREVWGTNPKNTSHILDWYMSGQIGAVPKELVMYPGNPGIGTPGIIQGPDVPTYDKILDKANPARIAFSKNDPRVHFWPNLLITKNDITVSGIRGDNTRLRSGASGINFTGGDTESANSTYAPNASYPEWRSNFYIAEQGMQSVGELGFIHAGKPWRSLSLQCFGYQTDEQSATPTAAIPDWAMMDLFTVYDRPIHGRININNAGWQAAYANTGTVNYYDTKDPSTTQPNLFYRYGQLNSWGQIGRRASSTANGKVPWSHTLSAALNVIPPAVRDNLVQYIVRRIEPVSPTSNSSKIASPYKPYYTIGELCEVFHMNYWDVTDSRNPYAYTDAAKEEAIRRICNVLTTRSDVFSVHVVAQTWGNGRYTGEARLMAVVKRMCELPASTTSTVPPISRFKILHLRWITD